MRVKLLDTRSYEVMMDTGKVEFSREIYSGLVLMIQEIQVRGNFLPLELGSTNVILGMKWLQILGDTKINWRALTMELMVDGRRIVIRGDARLSRAMVSLKSMMKTIQEGGGFLIELQSLERIRIEEKNNIFRIVQPLLQQFSEVFQPPVGLPLVREHEHAIILKEGVSLISIRPYRYPQI